MKKIKVIDNISGLQSFQLLKFLIFFIISVALAKCKYTPAEIGQWEMFLFIASFLSFSWVTGIIQSLLPLYHRNKSFRKLGDNGMEKSPEIFNAFLLLTYFSLIVFLLGHISKNHFSVFSNSGNVPYLNLLFLYILLSSPVCLIEYIYLLNNRSYRILQYGLYTFTAQLIIILIPIILHKDIIYSVYGLLIISGVRWVWLVVLLRRYAKWEISPEFLREHLHLATPLIITTLVGGSAQYIDGVIVTTVYRDPSMFAMFRYGAKEFPLATMLTAGLSSAMLPEFSTRDKMKDAMDKIKNKSKNLMHILFPVTMLTMFFTRWIYPRLFAPEFHVSAGVFMVYLLLIIPRVVFPHTILIGRKRTKVTMVAALIELVINIPLSLLMIRWGYGIVGVAVATLIVYIISRIILVVYLWMAMNIKPKEYIPVRVFLIYSALITLLFVLIDHRIIDFH